MAKFEVSGMTALEECFQNLEALPTDILHKMLDVQADIVVEAQKKTAQTMLQGPYNKGAIVKAIRAGKIKVVKDTYVQDVTFRGKQHGVRLSEIAFHNEFGNRKQKARPFVATANKRVEEQIVEAADKVFDDFVESL